MCHSCCLSFVGICCLLVFHSVYEHTVLEVLWPFGWPQYVSSGDASMSWDLISCRFKAVWQTANDLCFVYHGVV